jgi:hypothetical protein
MCRLLPLLLALPLLAVAAPVPKAKVPKLEDVFGEVADPKDGCKYEMGPGGSLTVTVPKGRVETELVSVLPPMVAREVRGDFVVTVRVALELPAKPKPAEGVKKWPTVRAGLSVYTAGDNPFDSGRSVAFWWHYYVEDVCWIGSEQFSGKHRLVDDKSDRTRFARITRCGDDLTGEVSADGKVWEKLRLGTVKNLPASVSVGPFAFQTTDRELTATFDEYDIKPLPKDEKK